MKYAIGIDIGGTNTVLGLVDNQGVILGRDTMLTKDESPSQDDYFKRLFHKVSELTESHPGTEPVGIGIGAPNGNHYSGMILDPPNLDLGNVHVPTIAMDYTRLSIVLTNDANAAALGEKMFGRARNMDDFVLITLGTGLGSGVFTNGQLLVGHGGFAGEMGHIIIDPKGRECSCGKRGCLEMYASAKGITETIQRLMKTIKLHIIFTTTLPKNWDRAWPRRQRCWNRKHLYFTVGLPRPVIGCWMGQRKQ